LEDDERLREVAVLYTLTVSLGTGRCHCLVPIDKHAKPRRLRASWQWFGAVDTLRWNNRAFLTWPRGSRGQAHVVLWRQRQRVKRRSTRARRGIRPCDHETETNTDVLRPARSTEYHSLINHLVYTLVSEFNIPVLQLLDVGRA
jgi:hypothetical protein